MKTKTPILSVTHLQRLKVQGYTCQTSSELTDLAFGNQFAFQLCVSFVIIGMAFSNMYILSTMMIIALGGAVLPNHPFDYIYNYLLANRM